MTLYVLDASVAAKWVLPPTDEPLAMEALEVLRSFSDGKTDLIVPDLFWAEIGNILWKSVRTRRISEATALDATDSIQSLGIHTFPAEPLLPVALRIALTFDRTVYDSVYVALAISSGKQLLTADERLVNALGATLPVRWLGSIA